MLGLDLSEKMLARAMADTADARVVYQRADLERLELPPASFTLAYSSLALHYINDLDALLRTVHDALTPGAKLIFSIEHPIYMASRHADWIVDSEGRRTWPVDSYQIEGPRVTNWLSDGVVKQHRTLGTLLNLLIDTGFRLDHINEWGPTAKDLAALPSLADEVERPMLVIVAATRW